MAASFVVAVVCCDKSVFLFCFVLCFTFLFNFMTAKAFYVHEHNLQRETGTGRNSHGVVLVLKWLVHLLCCCVCWPWVVSFETCVVVFLSFHSEGKRNRQQEQKRRRVWEQLRRKRRTLENHRNQHIEEERKNQQFFFFNSKLLKDSVFLVVFGRFPAHTHPNTPSSRCHDPSTQYQRGSLSVLRQEHWIDSLSSFSYCLSLFICFKIKN